MLVTQLCLTLCNPMDCNPPGSFVHGIFQTRILKWIAIPFSTKGIFKKSEVKCSPGTCGQSHWNLAKTGTFATKANICSPTQASQDQDWARRSFDLPVPRAQGIADTEFTGAWKGLSTLTGKGLPNSYGRSPRYWAGSF